MDKGLSLKQAQDIISDKNQWLYFQKLMEKFSDKLNEKIMVKLYNLVTIDLANLYNKTKILPWDSQLSWDNVVDLFNVLDNKTITLTSYKELLEKLWHTSGNVHQLIEDNNMTLVDDIESITNAVQQALQNNPQEIIRYKNGETKLLKFFVGQIMKITKGQGDHSKIEEILIKELNK